MKHQIKHRYTDAVLFECEVPDTVASGMATRHALEQATKARANLAGANLDGANLDGANLAGAYLARANLARANLAGANLDGANLARAYLAGAYLAGANLAGANLDGANLAGAYLAGANLAGELKLIGDRPVFQVGPIGSRCSIFTAYITNQGLRVTAGCFKQKTVEEFRVKLIEEHDTNKHRLEYEAALTMIEVHAEIWTPKEQS
jgi:uncharacterized protein YjbI with pentapeptide repeats